VSKQADAAAAHSAATEFWQALARDDDEAAGRVIVRGSIEKIGGLGPGVAARSRQATGKSRDECALMGVATCVSRCADGSYLVRSVRRRRLGMDIYSEPQWVMASSQIVVPLEGRWQVWGAPDGRLGQQIVEEIDVPTESPYPPC
jgi:hypothetical protein